MKKGAMKMTKEERRDLINDIMADAHILKNELKDDENMTKFMLAEITEILCVTADILNEKR